MLLLQNAGYAASSPTLADDSAISYEFADGKFVIEARGVDASGTFDTFPLRDTDFYFTWVDFAQPLAPAGSMDPTYEIQGPVTLTADAISSREAGIAISTRRPEALVTTIDNANTLGLTDPVTGQAAAGVLLGYFINTQTLESIGQPFAILGNPAGSLTRSVVAYNPVTDQYVVATTARPYGANNRNIPLIGFVNSSTNVTRVAKTVVQEVEAAADYDDIALAVSSANGNVLVVAEYQFGDIDPAVGEGVVGWMYDSAGNHLGKTWTRLDRLQPDGDEDDPDVVYLPKKDVFFFFTNTDAPPADALKNRLVGAAVATTLSADGSLQVGEFGLLDAQRLEGQPQGHPSALENPFTGEVLVAFDYGNGQANGDVAFRRLGNAPNYPLTTSRPQVAYSSGEGATPLAHRHPRLAADTKHGTIAVVHNRRESASGLSNAMVFALLDSEGQPLPGRPEGQYVLAEGVDTDPVPSDANFYDVAFDAGSESFLVVYNENNRRTRVARLRVTSNHLVGGGDISVTVRRVATGIELGWPVAAGDVVVEKAEAIRGPWAAVNTAPATVGDQRVVVVPTSGNAGYFRVRR